MDWPYRIWNSAGYLILVIRQWVEDSPDQTLIDELESHPSFRAAVSKMHQIFDTLPTELERNLVDTWAGSSSVQNRLAELGFPATPHTARFCLARSQGKQVLDESEMPTRGVIVQTFCIAPGEGIEGDWDAPKREHGESVFSISGSSTWSTDDLIRRCSAVVTKHAEFWQRNPHSTAPKIDLRRHNRRRHEPDDIDRDIDEMRAGRLSSEDVQSRAWENLIKEFGCNPGPFERKRLRRKINTRINRSQ